MSSKTSAMGKKLESGQGFWVVKFVQGTTVCGYVSLLLLTAAEVQMYPNTDLNASAKFLTKKQAQAVIDMHDGEVTLVGSVPFHEIYVDGSSVGDITETELKDRRTLSEEGFIAIFAVVDQSEEQIVTGPHIQARAMAEDQSVFDDILPELTVTLQEALEKGSDTYGMQQAMRRVIGRWASRKLRRSPMIIPTVVTV